MRSQSQHCCFFFFPRSGYSPSSWTPGEKVGGEPINVWIGWCRRLWWHKSNSSSRRVFFQCRPGFIHPEILSKQLVNRWELISRKQLVYPRRKRWPLGSALRVSLLCQICSFPSGFIVCGSRSLDVRSISHVFKFSAVQNLELETFLGPNPTCPLWSKTVQSCSRDKVNKCRRLPEPCVGFYSLVGFSCVCCEGDSCVRSIWLQALGKGLVLCMRQVDIVYFSGALCNALNLMHPNMFFDNRQPILRDFRAFPCLARGRLAA